MSLEDRFRAAGGHISSAILGPFRLAALAWFTRHETMLSILLAVPFVGYISMGWGWDDRFPLRPWPVPWVAPPDAEGRVYWSVTWLGFWIGVAL